MQEGDLRMEVVMERVADLVPYAGNAKCHDAGQVSQICNSIREFGFIDPVGVWTNSEGLSEIVEGHGRILAAQQLGIEEVPVIHLDVLTDKQRRAYALAHNQLTMSTGWDWELLNVEFDALADNFDMGDFGFFEVKRTSSTSDAVAKEQRFSENKEMNLDNFDGGNFSNECPRCGFRFN